jgi:hypothetical protein
VTDDLRYPVGRFVPPTAHDPAVVARAVMEIEGLPERARAVVAGLAPAQLDTPYRPDGWTVRQVVHHLVDSHLNAWCRIRLALTEDEPTIRPYDEARWAALADGRSAPLEPSLTVLDGLHARWVLLLRSLETAAWSRRLIHPEEPDPIPLWALVPHYAWHGRHHVAHITALRTRRRW